MRVCEEPRSKSHLDCAHQTLTIKGGDCYLTLFPKSCLESEGIVKSVTLREITVTWELLFRAIFYKGTRVKFEIFNRGNAPPFLEETTQVGLLINCF